MSIEKKKDDVWNKARKVRGKDAKLYRRDSQGNAIYKLSYGKQTDMGWEIDHSKPKSKGGTDHLNNLQPLQWEANRQKSNKRRKK